MRLYEWLTNRGLDPELAAKMGWVEAQGKSGAVLSIPYIRDEQQRTVQYRSLTTKEFRFKAGAEIELWNVDCLKDTALDEEPLVICEGACDGLAVMQSGFQRVIAVPGWSDSNLTAESYEPFKRHEEDIKRAKRIIVCQHDDNAGSAMLRGIGNFFDESDVGYVKWPTGCGDANDVLREFDADTLTEVINRAKSIDPPGGLITGFTDLPPMPERTIYKLNWEEFDGRLAWRTREVSVGTGVPGSGKTTFATWFSHQLVKQHGIRVGLIMFETEPSELRDHLLILSGCGRGASDEKIKAGLERMDKHYRLVHRVEDSEEPHGMLWLKRVIHALAARDGCRIIIIDPWNELEHSLEAGETMTQYLSLALMRLRQWAEKYDIHICVLAHPKKMDAGQRPSGYSIADSAAWANKPGFGWSINLETDDTHGDHVALLVWKVRSRQQTGCRPGLMRMTFLENEMSYRPIK